MKKILSLILFVTPLLMVFVTSCGKQYQHLSGGIEFEVDGIKYWVYRHADIDRQGRVISSSLLVSLRSSERIGGGTTEYKNGSTTVRLRLDNKEILAKTDTLYFVQEKIVVEKGYQELEIDASRLNAELEEMLDYLYPILKKMIQER